MRRAGRAPSRENLLKLGSRARGRGWGAQGDGASEWLREPRVRSQSQGERGGGAEALRRRCYPPTATAAAGRSSRPAGQRCGAGRGARAAGRGRSAWPGAEDGA